MDDGEAGVDVLFLILVPAALLGLILLVGFALVAVAIVAWPSAVIVHFIMKLILRAAVMVMDWILTIACLVIGLALLLPFEEPRTWIALGLLEAAMFFLYYAQADSDKATA
jgi:hypothetical protein